MRRLKKRDFVLPHTPWDMWEVSLGQPLKLLVDMIEEYVTWLPSSSIWQNNLG